MPAFLLCRSSNAREYLNIHQKISQKLHKRDISKGWTRPGFGHGCGNNGRAGLLGHTGRHLAEARRLDGTALVSTHVITAPHSGAASNVRVNAGAWVGLCNMQAGVHSMAGVGCRADGWGHCEHLPP
jgi:hypothetical protein